MQDLGIEVLFKGNNFIRLLAGLWISVRLALIAMVFSILLGFLLGMIMTSKNRIVRLICRIYLEIVRIMPQLVLLFLVYFGAAKHLGINISGEIAGVIVFTFWGTAEMGDLVRSASVRKCIQLRTEQNTGIFTDHSSTDDQKALAFRSQSSDTYDKDNIVSSIDRCGRSGKSRQTDH